MFPSIGLVISATQPTFAAVPRNNGSFSKSDVLWFPIGLPIFKMRGFSQVKRSCHSTVVLGLPSKSKELRSVFKSHASVVSFHRIVAGVNGDVLNSYIGSPFVFVPVCSYIPRSTIKPDKGAVPGVAPTPGPISPRLSMIDLSSICKVD